MYILAGVAAQTYVLILLMRPPPKSSMQPPPSATKDGAKQLENVDDLKKPKRSVQYITWVLYTVCLLMQCTGHFVPMNYFPMKGHQDGIDKEKIPILVSVIGATGIISRPIAGIFSDRFINRITLAIISLLVCGLLLIISTFLHTFIPFLILCLFIGIIQCKYIYLSM